MSLTTQKRAIGAVCVYHLPWALDVGLRMLEALPGASWLLAPLDWLRGVEEEVVVDEAARLAAIEEKEREFHDFVREHIICLLLFISLYLFSYWLITRFKERTDSDSLYAGEEDYIVYRIAVWMCTVSLAGSLGSIALLPFSILGAELLQEFRSSYYLQWLSWSLIHSLWNYVFFLSNLSLFVLLPFAYFFIESQGFNKKKNGLLQRTYETCAVCAILVVVLLCLSDLICRLLLKDGAVSGVFGNIGITSLNVPLLYSVVSLLGVILLLVSTPIGFAKMIAIVCDMAQIRSPPNDDVSLERLLQSCCHRRQASPAPPPPHGMGARSSNDHQQLQQQQRTQQQQQHMTKTPVDYGCDELGYGTLSTSSASSSFSSSRNQYGQARFNGNLSNGYGSSMARSNSGSLTPPTISFADLNSPSRTRIRTYSDCALAEGDLALPNNNTDTASSIGDLSYNSDHSSLSSASSSTPSLSTQAYRSPFTSFTLFPATSAASSVTSSPPRTTVVPMRHPLRWYQSVLHSLKFTVIITAMVAITAMCVLLVAINTLKLLLGYRALPVYAQYIEVNARHRFGTLGLCLEIVIIIYMMATSIVGVYSMPLFRKIRPRRGRTSITAVIINCSMIVIMSSALPVLATTLGLTTFDLLGLYSSLKWLSNFRLVLAYNLLFAVVTSLVLVNKATTPIRAHFGKSIRELRLWRSNVIPFTTTEKDKDE